MRITFFGTGYVGIVSGTCFAEMGNDVLCVDINAEKVRRLNAGEIDIFEPGLEELVGRNRQSGRLRFTDDVAAGVAHADVLFIAVGTPSLPNGSADLSAVLNVARSIGACMTTPKLVVGKSTVPVGTADQVRSVIHRSLVERGVTLDFDVVSNPEFLKEGAAVSDFMKPDRIVIGANRPGSADTMNRLYAPFNRNHDKIVHMDVRSAELTKYAANVMLATRISLMNELANLAEILDADIESVRRGIGTDPRIGYHFIYPGMGYGGSCFPKDVQALIDTSRRNNFTAHIVDSVARVNEHQKGVLVEKILSHFGSDLGGRRFALWGLAFKPNTDDMREAPSQVVIERLTAAGASVIAYDPQAGGNARRLYADNPLVQFVAHRDAAVPGADALVVVTEWNEFRSPDFERLRAELKQPVIFDGRNLYDPGYLHGLGFRHYPIGRGFGDRLPARAARDAWLRDERITAISGTGL
ncbi:MAG: UDP-glucose/GDP-mannose dehydrogenase family protein [Pseudomonadales bacterium]|nr:UDP-glucose/GDP-mannose dehydrogenase family protein [Pseudomonadales bacterium]MCP5184587.1 UDP-glucose/GDP-mannose dehydrogenase family protein [Pseudomonadales bacterium]